MKPAIFLDRDGTLNVDVGYLHAMDQLELFPWTADSLRLLKRAGYLLVVITNQSGVATGYIREAFVGEAHAEIQARLAQAGVAIDAFYYCPHHVSGVLPHLTRDCRCRKPKPGMIEDAVRDHQIDVSRSWMLGDKWLDVKAGQAAGVRTILLRTGWGREAERSRPEGQEVDAICDNLAQAVALILQGAQGA
jgi:D-glycero-D-manno-heptose 1,7-bisphosphate phosphatase